MATDPEPGGHDPNETERRPRSRRAATIAALALGLSGFVVSAVGVAIAVLPRHFSAGEQRRIMAWEVSGRWRERPAGQIFPGSVTYSLPATVIEDDPPLSLRADRVAIAPQSDCAAAVTGPAAAAVLRHRGCEAVLRATYIDQTSSFVVTVGVAVLPTPSAATAVSGEISGTELAASRQAGALPAGVRTVRFTGSAGGMYDYSRQISATMPAGPYLVMYAAGYADGRPRVPLAHDSYSKAEMASMAEGVADSVANGLDAAPPMPRCPGDAAC